jgi:hypothetical protein
VPYPNGIAGGGFFHLSGLSVSINTYAPLDSGGSPIGPCAQTAAHPDHGSPRIIAAMRDLMLLSAHVIARRPYGIPGRRQRRQCRIRQRGAPAERLR